MSRTIEWRVEAQDADERADVVLGRRVPGLSRRQARALALAGRLSIDGRASPPSTRVTIGRLLQLRLDDEGPQFELEALALTDDFVYVCKPAGVHSIALTPDQPGVLASEVARRWPECASASEDPREGGAVHRLDRPTSGVVAFARNREAWLGARDAFRAGRVVKHYLAVCEAVAQPPTWPPTPPAGALPGWIEPCSGAPLPELDHLPRSDSYAAVRIRAPIGRVDAAREGVRLSGRRASTVVQPLASATEVGAPRWLVHILLETGVRHQARVHLAWIGFPIEGDLDYREGGPTGAERTTVIKLHAYALDLSPAFPTERTIVALPAADFWT